MDLSLYLPKSGKSQSLYKATILIAREFEMSRWTWARAKEFVSDRRSFLLSGGSLAVLPWVGRIASGFVQRNPVFSKDPFQLGVTSGDPGPSGMVLWTRLAPSPLAPSGGLPETDYEVTWLVASDESMKTIVRSGKSIATSKLGHSVHVEVDGLEPDRWYWYRFRCGDAESPVGRTRTTPVAEAMPSVLRFAFASCQHYESGLYTAYQHMCQEPLDLIIHLGDYIYEGAGKDGPLRKHLGPELYALSDYRTRYAQYKSDQHLIAAHQCAPWLVVWDDHEFDNNYANLISEENGIDPASFALRRADAYQAYYENMPLRASAIPIAHNMQLYRRVVYGQLAQFDMLDTRQYRTDQPNGDGSKPVTGDALSPSATMLGPAQEAWLIDGLAKSKCRWNILGQQVMMARADRAPGEDRKFSMDQWAGYDVARKRLLQTVSDLKKTGTVVLTGDIHNHWANNLHVDFDNPKSPIVASELVGTSISSGGNGIEKPKYLDALLTENPFVKFHNAERGYVSCTVTPEEWRAEFQTVPFVDKPNAPKITRAKFRMDPLRPGLEST
jgi:alkaline phosphatase D